jgi:hypothetical protein
MNKSIFIIAIIVAILLGGGYLLINSDPKIKAIAEQYGIIEKPAPKLMPVSHNAVFCIFDPSGSGKTSYSVPNITIGFVKEMISSIEEKGNGELWLTFIDRSALNNQVLYFKVKEEVIAQEKPVRKSGELKGEFDKRMADFESESAKEATKQQVEIHNYNIAKENFLKECDLMITKAYAPKKQADDYSDVIGSLNVALRSLTTIKSDSNHFRSILLISDGVQDIPKGDSKQKLNEIPTDILLVTVNHSGSGNSVVAGQSIELDNLSRALEKVIRVYNPKNQ